MRPATVGYDILMIAPSRLRALLRVASRRPSSARRPRCAVALLSLALTAGCSEAAPRPECLTAGGQAAPSTCLTPQQTAAYYAAQSVVYFDSFDTSASRASLPLYAERVARWEWPPWLKLTGYGKDTMSEGDALVLGSTPSTVPVRDCRGFTSQPFGRCHVSFQYAEGSCGIYEEFTFNDQGEMTFIEAWSDLPGLWPMTSADDRWAEQPGAHRLSTRLPGLGSSTGRIDPWSTAMAQAAATDPEIADFVARAKNFTASWLDELGNAGADLYVRGCGWPAPPPPRDGE